MLDVDYTEGRATLSLWVRASWYDSRLDWRSADYGGLAGTVADVDDIWTPDFLVYNHARKFETNIRHKDTRIFLYADGTGVYWTRPAVVEVLLNIDAMHFPFDTQDAGGAAPPPPSQTACKREAKRCRAVAKAAVESLDNASGCIFVAHDIALNLDHMSELEFQRCTLALPMLRCSSRKCLSGRRAVRRPPEAAELEVGAWSTSGRRQNLTIMPFYTEAGELRTDGALDMAPRGGEIGAVQGEDRRHSSRALSQRVAVPRALHVRCRWRVRGTRCFLEKTSDPLSGQPPRIAPRPASRGTWSTPWPRSRPSRSNGLIAGGGGGCIWGEGTGDSEIRSPPRVEETPQEQKFYACCPNEAWPFIRFRYTLTRRPSFYITTIIMPMVATAVSSFATFLLPHSCSERLGLGITCVLVMLAINFAATELLPVSEDTTTMDEFQGLCNSYTTLSLVMTVLSSILYSQAQDLGEAQASSEREAASPDRDADGGLPISPMSSSASMLFDIRGAFFRQVLGMSPQTALMLSFRIDYYCAICFTVSYACICAVVLNPQGSGGVKFLTALLVALGFLLAAAGFLAAIYLLRRWRGRDSSAFKPGVLLRYLAYTHHSQVLSATVAV